MNRFSILALILILLSACATSAPPSIATPTSTATVAATFTPVPPTVTLTPTIVPTATPRPLVPNFDHIVLIVFENKEFGTVIGSPLMPNYNKLAQDYTLLTEYYAIRHPSLPNYIAMIGGDTFGIDSNCHNCFLNNPSLPDLIEASGRTWKTYQEDMPEPCYIGDTNVYAQKHNAFIYFDPIRLNTERCRRSVVPLTDLPLDIAAGSLPNFIFIMGSG